MAESSLTERVDILEQIVAKLSDLPDRAGGLEQQFVQFRQETRAEFSGVRDEFAAVRQEMREEFSAVRAEIRAGDEETRRFMRVLHEDVIDRITLLGEGKFGPPQS
jgi:hypothetical protein